MLVSHQKNTADYSLEVFLLYGIKAVSSHELFSFPVFFMAVSNPLAVVVTAGTAIPSTLIFGSWKLLQQRKQSNFSILIYHKTKEEI